MKAKEPIPDGWYKLSENDTLQSGDMCPNLWGKWAPIDNGFGRLVSFYSLYEFIRKKPDVPDKEWLNPWD